MRAHALTVHSAESATRFASSAYQLWVRVSDAMRWPLPKGWVNLARRDTVNGEDAILFVHPWRMDAVVHWLGERDMPFAQLAYVCAYLSEPIGA